jgi:hypothetical protein
MRDGTRPMRFTLMLALASGLVLVACDSGRAARPTDPREILVEAVEATAALETVRIHGDVTVDVGAMVDAPNAVVSIALDADLEVATRQFTARMTTDMPAAMRGAPGREVVEVISTRTATFAPRRRTGAG